MKSSYNVARTLAGRQRQWGERKVYGKTLDEIESEKKEVPVLVDAVPEPKPKKKKKFWKKDKDVS